MCWSGCLLDYRGGRSCSRPGLGSRSGVQPGAVGACTRKNYLTPGPISVAQLSTFVHTIGNARWPSMSSGAGAEWSPPRAGLIKVPAGSRGGCPVRSST
jgi:hypothetical protein